ncbi:MAG TPA: NTP transferase domain-containing protein [Candidatus Baltobacteraceae bacterium]|jgi:GTP:adenosylcobinamide-phosphate guanylyltransferase|nr:NTP transferase domain-containing protein [Candidatus Baltobacteraceae bacterium]
MNAVITAGGRVDGEFARTIGVSVKALAPFVHSTFLEIAIRAAREAGADRIAVVGGDEVARAAGPDVRVIREAPSGAENLRLALGAWDHRAPLLYMTSDMPFVTGDAVKTFIAAAPADALALPLTEWPDFSRRFPAAPPFGITLAGEKVVNGGAFLIPPGAAPSIERFATQFFDARKSPLRMAALTGIPLLLQFLLRRLSVARLEEHAQRLLHVPAKAVRQAPPELAYDVDLLEEYRYAVAHA